MKILQRYFLTEIVKGVLFILIAFMALFAFFDLVGELRNVGRGHYRFINMLVYIFLGFPRYIYELMPFAVLIGTIYAMSRFAQNSEFTIMRASSLSTRDVVAMLAKIGVVFLVATFMVGEFVAPYSSQYASDYRANRLGAKLGVKAKAGVWGKDTLNEGSKDPRVPVDRFINFKDVKKDETVGFVRLYEMNYRYELIRTISADGAKYLGNRQWMLYGVTQTLFEMPQNRDKLKYPHTAPKITVTKIPNVTVDTDVTPALLSIMSGNPNQMSLPELLVYSRHLEDGRQDASVYRVTFWKRIIYPFTVFVMMGLALPFAYLHFRSGGMSVKIFVGIMIGIAFVLFNNLFSHIGLLNDWWPLFTAATPSLIFLICAVYAIRYIERH